MEAELQRYGDYRPTGCDPRGLGLEDRQDWLVAPGSITRDTQDSVTLSNWRVMLQEFKRFNLSGNDYEVHRFGHWGPGWFEIVLVRPGTQCVKAAEEIACTLADYPVLDEHDLSSLELDLESEAWDTCYEGDFRKALSEAFGKEGMFFDMDSEDLWSLLRLGMERANEGWEHGNEGACLYHMDRIIDAIEAVDLPT